MTKNCVKKLISRATKKISD